MLVIYTTKNTFNKKHLQNDIEYAQVNAQASITNTDKLQDRHLLYLDGAQVLDRTEGL